MTRLTERYKTPRTPHGKFKGVLWTPRRRRRGYIKPRASLYAASVVTLMLSLLVGNVATGNPGDLLWEDQFDQAKGIDFASSVAANRQGVFAAGAVDNDFAVRAYHGKTGRLLWMNRTGGAAGNFDAARAIAVGDQRVFAAGSVDDGAGDSFTVRAYNARTGKLLWKDQNNSGGSANALSLRRDRVFVAGAIDKGGGDEFTVRAYDSHTGAVLWEDQINEDHGSARALVVSRGRVFVAGSAGVGEFFFEQDLTVRAYDARTGNLLWIDRVSGTAANQGETAFAVAAEGNMVYVAGFLSNVGSGSDFTVRAYDAKRGRLRWEDQVVGMASGTDMIDHALAIAVRRGRVFVAGRVISSDRGDFLLRVYDAMTGKPLWVAQTDGAVTQADDSADAVAVGGGRVFAAGSICDDPETLLGCGDFTVRAYKARTGKLIWNDVAIGTAHATDNANAVVVQGNRVFAVGQIVDEEGGRDFFVRAYRAK